MLQVMLLFLKLGSFEKPLTLVAGAPGKTKRPQHQHQQNNTLHNCLPHTKKAPNCFGALSVAELFIRQCRMGSGQTGDRDPER